MDDPKYIIFDSPLAGPTAIVFPAFIGHNEIRDRFGWPVLSAGFLAVRCSEGHDTSYVYGRSVSLGLEAKIKDIGLVKRQYNLNEAL